MFHSISTQWTDSNGNIYMYTDTRFVRIRGTCEHLVWHIWKYLLNFKRKNHERVKVNYHWHVYPKETKQENRCDTVSETNISLSHKYTHSWERWSILYIYSLEIKCFMTVHAHDAPFLEYICIIREGQEKNDTSTHVFGYPWKTV